MSRALITSTVPRILLIRTPLTKIKPLSPLFLHSHPAKQSYPAFPPATFWTFTSASTMSSNPVFKLGNTAVITGGASGIGLALATKCASYGMSVIIADNNSVNLAAAKSSIKGKVESVEMDVSKIEDFEKLKSKVEKDLDGSYLHLSFFNFEPGDLRGTADDIIDR